MMTKPADLAAAIAAVETIHAEADAPLPEQYSNYDAWKARDAAGKAALQRIVDELGGRAGRSGGSDHRLSLLGVSTTCTAGEWGLITNWLAAARLKLGNRT